MLHDAGFRRLEGQRQPQRTGRHQIDPQHLRGRKRQGDLKQDGRDHQQPFAAVRGQHEQHELLQVVVDRAAFPHRRGDRREIVVRQHHVGRFLGRLGAFQAHRHAHVGALERGRVVHPVARHGNHLPLRLHRLNQPQLMFGTGARVDIDPHHHLPQRRVVHQRHLGARDRRLAHADIQLGADRARRLGVVAGDHLDLDPGLMALGHGRDRLCARRVHHAHQRQQHEAALHVIKVQGAARRAGALAGQAQHPQSLGRRIGGHAPPVVHVQRLGHGVAVGLRAAHVQHPLGRPLHENPWRARPGLVIGRHETMLGLERDRIPARPFPLARRLRQAHLPSQDQQRPFGGVALDAPGAAFLPQHRVVAEHAGADGQPQRGMVGRIGGTAIDAALARRLIAHPADIHHRAGAHHTLHRHLVARERARLVGTDHRHRTQRLHRRQPPHDRLPPRHALHTERQRNGHDGRQPFRNRRSRQRHHHHEHLRRRMAQPPRAHGKQQPRKRQDHHRQHTAKVIHLAQQRRGHAVDARQ
ncbi:hypothetical protein D9M68_536570 [compost metagenome]